MKCVCECYIHVVVYCRTCGHAACRLIWLLATSEVGSFTAVCHDSMISKSALLKEFLLGAQQVGCALRLSTCMHAPTSKQADLAVTTTGRR